MDHQSLRRVSRPIPVTALSALCACVVLATAPHVLGRAADAIRVDVMVEDAAGKPVAGLTRDDFEIWSDNERRPIDGFSVPSSNSPLTLVVLVDITASQSNCPALKPLGEPVMNTPGRGSPTTSSTRIGGSYGRFVIQGFRPVDRVRVGSIGRQFAMSARFTSDAAAIKSDWQALFDVPPVEWLGPSPIWDAVERAVGALAAEPGHRAIVLVTDGQASGNVHGYSEVSAQAALAGVSVSIVAEDSMLPTIPLTSMASYGVDPALRLRSMADFTGGSFALDRGPINPDDRCFPTDPARLFKAAVDRLHQTYTLTFAPVVTGGTSQRLDVRVKKAGMSVRARKLFRES
jgi:VWFA-related protein